MTLLDNVATMCVIGYSGLAAFKTIWKVVLCWINHNQAWPYQDPENSICKARYTQVGSTLLSLSVNSDVALVYGGPSLDSQDNGQCCRHREYEASPVISRHEFNGMCMNAVLLVARKQAVFAVILLYLEPRAPFHCNRFFGRKTGRKQRESHIWSRTQGKRTIGNVKPTKNHVFLRVWIYIYI